MNNIKEFKAIDIDFRPVDEVIATVKHDLASMDANNLINENRLYLLVRELLHRCGLSFLKPEEGVAMPAHFRVQLPQNFVSMYAVYKVTPQWSNGDRLHAQNGYVMYTDTTCESVYFDNCCIQTEPCVDERSRITVRTYVKDHGDTTYNFQNPILLQPKSRRFCAPDALSAGRRNAPGYTITGGDSPDMPKFLNTEFSDDWVYFQYYVHPQSEESGLPMIPDLPEFELALEYYIKYKLFENFWADSQVPDLERKVAYYERLFREKRWELLHYIKLMPFTSAVNRIRTNRAVMGRLFLK